MDNYSRAAAFVDLDAVSFNLEQVRKRLKPGTKILVVLKTDGYGHGAAAVAKIGEKLDFIWGYATASFEEAVSLQKSGIKKPVLVLGCIFPRQYEEAVNRDIRAAVYTKEMAQGLSKAAVKAGRSVNLHIKIDTGMGRLGFSADEESVKEICGIAKFPNVALEGMFTHFSKADEADKSYTYKQHALFMQMKEAVERENIHIPYYHCDNSAGIIDLPDMAHGLVRSGIMTYGLYPSGEVDKCAVKLKPALELVSRVIYVKDVAPGTRISYGGTFTADRPMKVATISAGYGDGYPRALSNRADVLIRGKRARILGRICMDLCMADVTDIPGVSFMDKVVLIGADKGEHISVEELSAISGKINYELVCGIGKRVPRIYIKDGKAIEEAEYLS